jgi:hypothetical protein
MSQTLQGTTIALEKFIANMWESMVSDWLFLYGFYHFPWGREKGQCFSFSSHFTVEVGGKHLSPFLPLNGFSRFIPIVSIYFTPLVFERKTISTQPYFFPSVQRVTWITFPLWNQNVIDVFDLI